VQSPIEARIDVLARRDRLLAVTSTVLMWVVLVFVLIVASAVAPTAGIVVALVGSMLLLGLINTASMVALVRRYAANKDVIYRPDIVNLDRMRHERAQRKA
jgi:Cu/Ag efflux pump CusA